MRKKLLESSRREVEEVDENQRHPFPSEIALWSVDDVCRWLDTLQLGEYKRAFKDGKASRQRQRILARCSRLLMSASHTRSSSCGTKVLLANAGKQAYEGGIALLVGRKKTEYQLLV